MSRERVEGAVASIQSVVQLFEPYVSITAMAIVSAHLLALATTNDRPGLVNEWLRIVQDELEIVLALKDGCSTDPGPGT